jgi:hypothetical protein
VGLILWVEDGWLDGIEIHSAGGPDFQNLSDFRPADVFGPPEIAQ